MSLEFVVATVAAGRGRASRGSGTWRKHRDCLESVQTMVGPFVIRELAIVVVGRNHNPTILNPDFLRFNEIVPSDWELARPPLCTELIAQVVFGNRLSVVSQQDKIIFSEAFSVDGTGPVETPGVAQRYLNTVPHVDYQAVGVNPNGYVTFEDQAAVLAFAKDRFLAKGPWLGFGDGLHGAGIRFSYEVEGRTLNLSLDAGCRQSTGNCRRWGKSASAFWT